MKKIAFVVALVLFTCTAVSALAVSPAEFLGVWYLKSVEYNSQVALLEGDYRVEFNRDRSAVVVLNGTEEKATWALNDNSANVELEGGTSYFELQEDGTLKVYMKIIDKYGKNCVFSREKEEIKIPAVIDAASEDEYFGTYALTLQKTGNILIPIENGETLLKAVIEFALVTVSGDAVYDASVMSDYQDGKIIIPAYDIVSGATNENKLFIGKTETGIIVTCDVDPDTVYYLIPVEADETTEAKE